MLALNGRVQGKPLQPGTVGAILIPDEESVLRALDEESQLQFPLEIDADVPAGSIRSFASPQGRFEAFGGPHMLGEMMDVFLAWGEPRA